METDNELRQVLPSWKLVGFNFEVPKRSEFNGNFIKQLFRVRVCWIRACAPPWLFTISYPTRAHGIIVLVYCSGTSKGWPLESHLSNDLETLASRRENLRTKRNVW